MLALDSILDRYLEVDSILTSTLPRDLLLNYSQNTPKDLPTIPLPSHLQHTRHPSSISVKGKGRQHDAEEGERRSRQASGESDGEDQPLLMGSSKGVRERGYGATEKGKKKDEEVEGEDDGVEGREKRKEKRARLMLNGECICRHVYLLEMWSQLMESRVCRVPVNLIINVFLLSSKGAAVVLSNSISLLASFVDA